MLFSDSVYLESPPPSAVGFLTVVKMTRCNYQQQILSCNYKQSVQKVMNEVQKGLTLRLSALPPAQSTFLSGSPVLGTPGEPELGQPQSGPLVRMQLPELPKWEMGVFLGFDHGIFEAFYNPVYLSDFPDLTGMLRNAVMCLLLRQVPPSLGSLVDHIQHTDRH